MSNTSTSAADTVNLTLVGDGSVGKTSIIRAFRVDGFSKVYEQTVGCDFFEKKMTIKGDSIISLRVYDVGGQSINSKNLREYLGGASIVFLVYDLTNPESFSNLDDWKSAVKKYAPKSRIYLIGNKIDLPTLRQVTAEQHDEFIAENRLSGGCFFSAKTGENVLVFFYKVAAESLGIKLSDYELGFHDKVLKAYIPAKSDDDEARTAFADEIEQEDKRREALKNKRSRCCIS